MFKKQRTAVIKRKTKETNIVARVDIDGQGNTKINTGIGILNHLLELFAFHGLFDLELHATGDIQIDIHHTNEDIGLVLGEAFKEALGKRVGIMRFGFASVPMEEVLSEITLDISGRGSYDFIEDSVSKDALRKLKTDGYSFEYAEHLLESFAKNSGINIILKVYGVRDDLHVSLETIFKALGIALDKAVQIDPRRNGVPSTKGILD